MDIKTGDINVSIDGAPNKSDKASKLQQLEAMEEALKKATEEAHKQREALGESSNSTASVALPVVEIGHLHL